MYGRSLNMAYIAASLKEVCDTPFILQTPVCGKSILLYIRKIFCLYIKTYIVYYIECNFRICPMVDLFQFIGYNVVFSSLQCIYRSHLCEAYFYDNLMQGIISSLMNTCIIFSPDETSTPGAEQISRFPCCICSYL